jgi:hypothetical protein
MMERRAPVCAAVALGVASLTACGQPKGYDQMNLRTEEIGEARLSDILKPPANVGEITSWRTTFPGQVFAATRIEAACPRDIPTFVGVQYKKDRIELCYTVKPRSEPVPGFACSQELYLKYEIMGVPADVDPKFVFVGNCVSTTEQHE